MIRVLLVDDQALVRSGFRIILETEPDIEVVGEASTGVEAVALAASLAPDVICMDVEMPEMNGIEASRLILSAPGTGGGSGASDGGGASDSGDNGDVDAGAASGSRPPAILVLTTFGHEAYLFEALAAGVSGFLLKTSRAEQLIDAVRSLAAGNALLGPDVTRAVIERVAADRSAEASRAGASAPGATAATPGATAPGAAIPDAAPTGAPAAGTGPAAASEAQPAAATAVAADLLAERGVTEREREVLAQLSAGLSNAEIAATLFLGESTVKTHVSNLLQKLGVRDRIQAVVWAHTHGVTAASA